MPGASINAKTSCRAQQMIPDASFSRWRPLVPERRQIVMWGASDQGRVNYHILKSLDCHVVAWVDDTPNMASPVEGIPMLHGWESLERWIRHKEISLFGFVVAIGNPWGHVRCSLHDKLTRTGLSPVSFADGSALLCGTAKLGDALQVMPRAIIHNDASLARECIVNTAAIVEHDCVLEEGVEIGPGAILCGRVHVGANTWIGAGAVIRPRVRIGRNAVVGAGAVVVSDMPDGVVAIGVPARGVEGKSTPSARANA
jgi:sugar O-acyltransferase (sialic acid O-acetyltransferase NeuD family)